MGVSDETSQEINSKVRRATVARVLYLGNVFELIGNRLDNEALTQQKPVGQQHKLAFHILAQRGDELQAPLE